MEQPKEHAKQVTKGTLEMKTLRAGEVMAIFNQVVVVVTWRYSWCRVDWRRARPPLCPITLLISESLKMLEYKIFSQNNVQRE